MSDSLYHSPWEAYPFLSDAADDLRCDFELLTDDMASRVGLLRAEVENPALRAELLFVCELLYHCNPTLRTRCTVTPAERERLLAAAERLRNACQGRCGSFVLPVGCKAACEAHLLRVESKSLVRLVYRHVRQGHPAAPLLLDILNLLSGYFFYLALWLNAEAKTEEIEFISRNYPVAASLLAEEGAL